MRRLERICLLGGILGGLILLGGTREAHAELVPIYQGTTASDLEFTYNYSLNVGSSVRIETGDFFTIYDFTGFTGEHTTPEGWTFTSENLGLTPPQPPGSMDPGVLVNDSPDVPNLTWTYTGTEPLGPGPLALDVIFSANSVLPEGRLSFYAGRGTRFAPGTQTDGTKTANAGLTTVPVPEPVSMALLGFGGVLAVNFFRRRRV